MFKLFKEPPKTMDELKFRLYGAFGCALAIPFLLFVIVKLLISFPLFFLVLTILGLSIRALVRKLRQQNRR